MRRLLTIGALTLALALALSSVTVQASVEVDVLIENLTTGESGSSVSAAAGDQVAAQLTVTNNGAAQKVAVTVVAGTINCTHTVSANKSLGAGKSFVKRVKRTVPQTMSGTFVVDASALGADGSSASASASLAFGVSKVASGEGSGSVYERLFTRMVVRALLDSATNDSNDTALSATFGRIKGLYR